MEPNLYRSHCVNSSPLDNIADDIFKCISVNEKFFIMIEISMMFVPKGPIYNIPALGQIMA